MGRRSRLKAKQKSRRKRQQAHGQREQAHASRSTRRHRDRSGEDVGPLLDSLFREIMNFDTYRAVGACHPSVANPALIKYDYAEQTLGLFGTCPRFDSLVEESKAGALSIVDDLADLEHWLMEFVCWRGWPGEREHPLDRFLEERQSQLPPEAREQIRLWKLARLGAFEILKVGNGVVELREWDVLQNVPKSERVAAISLSVGHEKDFRGCENMVTFSYLAPWVPEKRLYCLMGYSQSFTKSEAAIGYPLLWLNHEDLVATPWPWNENDRVRAIWLQSWKKRSWLDWFSRYVRYPFFALVPEPYTGRPCLAQILGPLSPNDEEFAAEFGVYFDVELVGATDAKQRLKKSGQAYACGGTSVGPLDVTSPASRAFAEYRMYRHIVGPPPGVKGLPSHMVFEPSTRPRSDLY